MKFRLSMIAAALTMLAMGSVYADGSGDCNYSKYRYTSAQPQEPTTAEEKLASLDAPASVQTSDTSATTSAPQSAAAPATSQ